MNLSKNYKIRFAVIFFCGLYLQADEQVLPQQPLKQQVLSAGSTGQQSSKRQITIIREIINKNSNNDQLSLSERLNRIDDHQQFQSEFLKLDTRNKLQYLVSLTADQYEQFLQRFKDETEWGDFWGKLSADERSHIPSTLDRQYRLLRNCYYKYSVKSTYEVYWAAIKKNPPTDIGYWKSAYYERSFDFLNDFPETRPILFEDEVYRKKLKLLRVIRLD
jgi:hypothetical protein